MLKKKKIQNNVLAHLASIFSEEKPVKSTFLQVLEYEPSIDIPESIC